MKNRSVIKVIVFSLITFGIYTLFWLNDTRREMVKAGQDIPPLKLLLIPFITFLLFCTVQLVAIVTYFVTANISSTGIASDNTFMNGTFSIVILLLSLITSLITIFVLIPISLYWFYKYCKAVEVVTQNQTTLTFSYGLWIVLSVFGFTFIWPGLIQESFNKVSAIEPTQRFPTAPGI